MPSDPNLKAAQAVVISRQRLQKGLSRNASNGPKTALSVMLNDDIPALKSHLLRVSSSGLKMQKLSIMSRLLSQIRAGRDFFQTRKKRLSDYESLFPTRKKKLYKPLKLLRKNKKPANLYEKSFSIKEPVGRRSSHFPRLLSGPPPARANGYYFIFHFFNCAWALDCRFSS
ncbi:Zinc finger BED domain-containing protein DAYSLEEPER [Fusarium oxysporum f. sp. albedinis]|nr:Zinc finger BED domain-containing protein DAYSLEEPER [Fusarium oxysporum f. sp. albedinis]